MILSSLRNTSWRFIRNLFEVDDWNIGHMVDVTAADLVRRDEWSVADVDWLLEKRPLVYMADPYPEPMQSRGDGAMRLWYERYSYLCARGMLWCRTFGSDGSSEGRRVEITHPHLDDRTHLSYPSLIRRGDGPDYGLLEMSEAGRLDLFEVHPSASRWSYIATLLENVPAVDPTVVFHEGRWWLFCTRRDDRPERALYVFHADELRGPWTPHVANPVKLDVASSRPAGDVFAVDGTLYRPAQDCSRVYGGSVVVNRIVELTTERFREEVATKLVPDRTSAYPDALHTLRIVDDNVMIDGKRRTFHPFAAPVKLQARLRHRLRLRRGAAPRRTDARSIARTS